MSESKVPATLRGAIDAERRETLQGLERLKKLTDAMAAYQAGTGPAPTMEDFQEWLAKVNPARPPDVL